MIAIMLKLKCKTYLIWAKLSWVDLIWKLNDSGVYPWIYIYIYIYIYSFLVRWLPQGTLVPSFFSHLPPFFPFTCNLMWFIKLRLSAGISGYVWGVCECALVYMGVCGCARVSAGVGGIALVCMGVRWCV